MSDDPQPGPPLDGSRYQLFELIKTGATGRMYRGRHVELDKPVVVKLVDRALFVGRPDRVERFEREGRALALLDSPYVVTVLDAGRTASDQPYLVMERLRGRTLKAELAERKQLPVPEAIAIARQVLSGLSAAHAENLVHRDLKPAHVFLCEASSETSRRAKLIDFGIAKVLGDDRLLGPRAYPTEQGVVVGAPGALAPEQALGEPVDHRADLYAVALLLYEMVAGRHPFDKLPVELRSRTPEVQPEPPSLFARPPVPPGFDPVVLKGLAFRPGDRFPNAEAFRRALFELGEPIDVVNAEPVRFEPASAVSTDRVDILKLHSGEHEAQETGTHPTFSARTEPHAGGGNPGPLPWSTERLPEDRPIEDPVRPTRTWPVVLIQERDRPMPAVPSARPPASPGIGWTRFVAVALLSALLFALVLSRIVLR